MAGRFFWLLGVLNPLNGEESLNLDDAGAAGAGRTVDGAAYFGTNGSTCIKSSSDLRNLSVI